MNTEIETTEENTALEDLKAISGVVCAECGLPPYKGLPPFIKVSGKLQHRLCPDDPDEIAGYILVHMAKSRIQYLERKKVDFTKGSNRRWHPPRR